MADVTSTAAPSETGTSTKKKDGLLTFIKKNKTLSAVVGGIGGYLLYKMNKEKNSEGTSTEPEGTVSEVGAESGAIAGTAEAAAFELGRSERTSESARSEVEEIEEEREEEKAKVKEEKKTKEEQEIEARPEAEPNPTSPASPPESTPEVPATGPAAASINIHGRNFAGATGSHIAKSGQTEGGKKYVEYAVNFPGGVQYWQYFTATGNWRQVAGSETGGGANAPGPGNNPKPNPTPVGGPATNPNGKPKAKPVEKIGPAKPVAPAPTKPAPQPAPPRAPTCDPGTVGNILHARGEVNRLQGEINSLQANKPKGWAANVASKQATRNQFQQVVANGQAQPGCAAV